MAFWILTDGQQVKGAVGEVFWGPWLTREQAELMAEGRPIVGEDADGWPDANRRLTVASRDELGMVGIALDQWRANAIRLSKQLEAAQREVARLDAQAERLRGST